MEMFSMLKHSLVAEGANPITKHFTLQRQIASAGPEMIWKIYEATRNKDNKVGFCHSSSIAIHPVQIKAQ